MCNFWSVRERTLVHGIVPTIVNNELPAMSIDSLRELPLEDLTATKEAEQNMYKKRE